MTGGDPAGQARLRLKVLGRFELRRDGMRVVLPPSVERVIAYLALHGGPATRMNVAWTLWPDTSEVRAMASLRSTLWRLHRTGLDAVDCVGESVALSVSVVVDLWELTAVARRLVDGSSTHEAVPLDLLASSDEVLSDWYDEWIEVEREHVRQLRLQALERLAVELTAAGHFGRAAESALAAVATEPLRESAHRALIAVHLAQGNQSEAIRQYTAYRRLMHDELDLEPSAQMEDLLGQLLGHAARQRARPHPFGTTR